MIANLSSSAFCLFPVLIPWELKFYLALPVINLMYQVLCLLKCNYQRGNLGIKQLQQLDQVRLYTTSQG